MDSDIQLKLIVLGLWLYIVYRSAKPFLLGYRSVNWKKITGNVTTSTFDREGSFYSPKIIYKYSVNGKEYMNDIYTYMAVSSLTKKKSIKIVQSYPERSNIIIYIDNDKPENSVIVPGVHWSQYLSFLLVTLFLLSVAYIVPILNFIWPGCEPNCT